MAINVSELNTGKLTFEGVKIKGALGGSSDELDSDTIELVPDVDLYAAHQYLVIDPTDPDHIHIRAGGDIDDSNATLIFGGELSNITIDDQADAHVSIISRKTDDITSHLWQFNNNGSTRFPIIDADLHNESAPQEAEVLQFSSTYQSVITNAVPAIDVDAQRIIIQGQRATGSGEGGDVYLWGGDAESNGGDIKIYAGDADGTGGGYGGYVNIQGGSGYDNGGDVTIRGGTSPSNTGGSVAIYGGTGDSYGQVTITNDTYTWTFSSNGNTTIPNLKDIKDVAGNTVISGGNRVKNYLSSAGASIPVDENNIYAINTQANATNIKLPLSTTVPIGYELTVLDSYGNAQSKNITVTVEAGDEILSAPSGIAIDTNYGLLAFKYIGGKYWVILYGR